MSNALKRGEVWLADLNPTQGSEQAGIHPVIIFQNDLVSQFSTTPIAIDRQGKPIETVEAPTMLSGQDVLSGFVLNTQIIWQS